MKGEADAVPAQCLECGEKTREAFPAGLVGQRCRACGCSQVFPVIELSAILPPAEWGTIFGGGGDFAAPAKCANEHKKEGGEIPIHCPFDEMRDVVALVPHPRNPNRHPDSQIDLLGRVIRNQGRRNPIVVSKRSGFIVSGHGRLAAAEKIGAQVVPVDLQEFETEADELAHLAADNRIAELAEMDQDQLGELLTELEGIEDFDFELSGFERASLDELLSETDDERQSPGLVAEFGAGPFTVMDARTGRLQERKRAWLGRGAWQARAGETRTWPLLFCHHRRRSTCARPRRRRRPGPR